MSDSLGIRAVEFRRPSPHEIFIHRHMIRYSDEFRLLESAPTWFNHRVMMFAQLWWPLT
ncbi:hypothetical protein ACFWPX_27335 [Nocardia sp. NPDC058518]|uniref:hypothetical protein n=1 Tax=Nocardia sp. NPDC058518 TaxID=3346534 RepID=UPI00364B553C